MWGDDGKVVSNRFWFLVSRMGFYNGFDEF